MNKDFPDENDFESNEVFNRAIPYETRPYK